MNETKYRLGGIVEVVRQTNTTYSSYVGVVCGFRKNNDNKTTTPRVMTIDGQINLINRKMDTVTVINHDSDLSLELENIKREVRKLNNRFDEIIVLTIQSYIRKGFDG